MTYSLSTREEPMKSWLGFPHFRLKYARVEIVD